MLLIQDADIGLGWGEADFGEIGSLFILNQK
jgi:hypothetical protein